MTSDELCPNYPYVFFKNGQPIKCFKEAWNATTKRVGLQGRLFHDLRRTAVRNMVRAGVPEAVAMKISGHKIRSVYERYNIVDEADLKAASKKVSQHQRDIRSRVLTG